MISCDNSLRQPRWSKSWGCPSCAGACWCVPQGLPESSPVREIELRLECEPDERLVSKVLYRMSPAELVELKSQLHDLFWIGFLRLSTSPRWVSVLLFKRRMGPFGYAVVTESWISWQWREKYLLPKIKGLIDPPRGSSVCSSLAYSMIITRCGLWGSMLLCQLFGWDLRYGYCEFVDYVIRLDACSCHIHGSAKQSVQGIPW